MKNILQKLNTQISADISRVFSLTQALYTINNSLSWGNNQHFAESSQPEAQMTYCKGVSASNGLYA
jgi:hypothetical protein